MVERRRIQIQGAVQGVGFRPFVYRLAADLDIKGWVINSAQGVVIEVEAPAPRLDAFLMGINLEKPPHSFIQHMTVEQIPAAGETTFEIRHSSAGGSRSAVIVPDLATCPDCLDDITDPANRRYRYPFTNCTHCGPRYTIIERLPYDRPNTTMRAFTMCESCRAEYEDPLNRRFHAQPNACPHCGPQLSLWNRAGHTLSERDEALLEAARAIRDGAIVALKGMGGFQLLVDARNTAAVRRLRERKQRPDKPFAVMIPTLEQVKALCDVSSAEEALLCSSEAPIVLLRRTGNSIASEVAPDNPNLGVMLPYTPLHHLLLADLGFPIVATSGNLSGEPLCTDECEALARLSGIADYFLVHNRPITRPVDDSVTRVMAGTSVVLRRARGYAPLPVQHSDASQDAPAIIATGAHLKNTVAVSKGQQAILSQHIGDLEAPETVATFRRVLSDLQTLYDDERPALIACDLHPDYRSTQVAEELAARTTTPLLHVQHHYAHVLAGMAEHHLRVPVLGVAWDGTGYGTDGTIWGGEFLRVAEDSGNGFERVAHLRPFPLPGGEQAVREPRRSALGLLYAMDVDKVAEVPGFSPSELAILKAALRKGINAPYTSSMGRFFDGVAALLGLRQRASFEGQAAMDLEFACEASALDSPLCVRRGAGGEVNRAEVPPPIPDRCYAFDMTPVTDAQGHVRSIIEWQPVVRSILHDLSAGLSISQIAAVFHNTLTEMIVRVAVEAATEQVVLCGGCFQNKRLLEGTIRRLQEAGFRPYWNQKIPMNDGGIALGQIAAAQREMIGQGRTAVCV